jgi:hypothetical protein
MYSFPKANRFPSMKIAATSNTFYYTLPDVKSKRAASLGYGKKYDFTKSKKDIKSGFYNLGTDFDAKKPHSPAFTFGISRGYYNKVYLETAKMFDKDVPGPGKYDFLKPFGGESSKYSMLGKHNPKYLSAKSKFPGPGEYPPIALKPDGRYILSGFKNTVNIVWGHSKALRFPSLSIYNF